MDTDSFIVCIKIDDMYKDIREDVIIQTINQIDHCLWINVIVFGLMRDELGGKIMTEFVGLKAKTSSYLIDDGNDDKKAKDTKKCVIKLNYKIMKTVQKQVNLIIKSNIL